MVHLVAQNAPVARSTVGLAVVVSFVVCYIAAAENLVARRALQAIVMVLAAKRADKLPFDVEGLIATSAWGDGSEINERDQGER